MSVLHKTFESFLTDRGFETGNLPGSRSYKSTVLEKGRMMKMPPSVTLVHQPYRHVDHLEFMNVNEIQEFVKHWQLDLHQITQRCGWLYGYYIADPNSPDGFRAVVEAIYEPPQECQNDEVVLLPDPLKASLVDPLVSELGLEPVGFIFTSLARGNEHLMNSRELVRSAKFQMQHATSEHYTKYSLSKFTTCIIHPDMAKEASPQTDVFMVSDQLCGMIRDGLVGDQTNSKRMQLREALPGEIQPQVLEAGKNASEDYDPDWFVVKVNSGAPVQPKSLFAHSHFPRENRAGVPQFRSDLKRYFAKCPAQEPNWMKLADFHLLIFIANVFDLDTAKVLCQAVRDQTDVDNSLMELMQDAADN